MDPNRDDYVRQARFQDTRENFTNGRVWKVGGAVLLILIMFLADLLAMFFLFYTPENDVPPMNALLYSFIFALCLEGIPTFLGSALAIWTDNAQYRENDKSHAMIGMVVCGIASALMFGLAIGLRVITIFSKGGPDGFFDGKGYSDFPVDFFLVFSPILTSTLAFAVSWFTFRNDNEKIMEQKVAVLQNRYIARQNEFLEEFQKLQDARSSLWTTLTAHRLTPEDSEGEMKMGDVLVDGKPNELSKWMPNKSEVFRKESFARIRGKLIENCIITYPSQVARYNESVESTLRICLELMRSRTSLPVEFSELQVQEIIDEFDRLHVGTGDVWDYDEAKGFLESELRRLVDNAIVVAQRKTTAIPYPLERY